MSNCCAICAIILTQAMLMTTPPLPSGIPVVAGAGCSVAGAGMEASVVTAAGAGAAREVTCGDAT